MDSDYRVACGGVEGAIVLTRKRTPDVAKQTAGFTAQGRPVALLGAVDLAVPAFAAAGDIEGQAPRSTLERAAVVGARVLAGLPAKQAAIALLRRGDLAIAALVALGCVIDTCRATSQSAAVVSQALARAQAQLAAIALLVAVDGSITALVA